MVFIWKRSGITVPILFFLCAWIISYFFPESDKIFYDQALPWSLLSAGVLVGLQALLIFGMNLPDAETGEKSSGGPHSFMFVPVWIWAIAFLAGSVYFFITTDAPEPIELETQVEVSSEEGTSGGDFAAGPDFENLHDSTIYQQGLALYEDKKYKKSIPYFTEVIDRKGRWDAIGYKYRGKSQVKLKNRKEGIADLKMAYKLNSELPSVLNTIGINYDQLGELDSALVYYYKYLDVRKDAVTVHYNICLVKVDMEDYKGASESIEKYISLDDTDPDGYYYRGLVNHNLGNKSKVCPAINKAVELGLDTSYFDITKYCPVQ